MSIVLEKLKQVERKLDAVAACAVPEISPHADGDSLRILTRGLSDSYAAIVAEVQDVLPEIKEARSLMEDMQLSREPDVERIAEQLFLRGGINSREAFTMAEGHIKERNERRSARARGAAQPAPTAKQPVQIARR
jgi:hypothetical protein